jgi:hypothetical protein
VAVLEFELWALHSLGRCYTHTPFTLLIFLTRVLCFCPGLPWTMILLCLPPGSLGLDTWTIMPGLVFEIGSHLLFVFKLGLASNCHPPISASHITGIIGMHIYGPLQCSLSGAWSHVLHPLASWIDGVTGVRYSFCFL